MDIHAFALPADGKDYFQAGDFIFDIDDTQSGQGFDYSGAVTITIVAKTSEVKEAVKKKLLDDYEPTGEVKVVIPALGIYKPGFLEGALQFKEDKQETPYLSMDKSGFQYSLKFFGDVVFRDGWVAMLGHLKPSWDEKPLFPVNIFRKINKEQFNWEQYTFTSVEEAAGAPVEQVKKLVLVNPEFSRLPNEFYRLKSLQRVEITPKWPIQQLPLERLDDKLLELKDLEYLVVANSALCRIPEYMNKLTQLRHCSFAGGKLSRVPAHLMDMPRLEYLNLNGNQISDIAVFNMPDLKYLHLAKNQLKTLPENLLSLPKIEKINVSGNPFSFLPPGFSDFAGLELDIKSKQQLLDNTYKDADGNGPVNWNNEAFFAQHDEALIHPVDEIIAEEKELLPHRDALRALVKRAIGFNQTGEEDYAATGNHRFGGMPDLPAGIDYPEFYDDYNKRDYKYQFIAQVNCEALSPLQEYLPRTGTLFFFFETIHSLGSRGHIPCKVLYVEDNSTLQSGRRFSFAEEDFFELEGGQYTPYKADAFVRNSVPGFYSWHSNQYLFRGVSRPLLDDEDLMESLYETFEEPVNFLLESDHAINSYGFTQHESPELQAALACKGNPEDWTILLTVKSRGDFQWGDAGDLFFVIHKSDLAKKDFRKVYVTLESS
ncbi:DUF1963 domain-containing protein [Chitinophaga sp.]|uniref:DUF1963 domain-containing protein n=1 Tax=Chitinophaga sp. TaxID=1869181 RepID=UPI002CEE9153|nr:DUF1963 domain-containing protein [Chitinophaga sp.]HWV64820.1 DUF1963 domain-containing protein [Chitinophaga sp.]